MNPTSRSIGGGLSLYLGMIWGAFSLVLEQETGEEATDGPAQEKIWGTQRTMVGVLDGGSKQSLMVKSLGSVVRLLVLEFLLLCLTFQPSSHTPSTPAPQSVV